MKFRKIRSLIGGLVLSGSLLVGGLAVSSYASSSSSSGTEASQGAAQPDTAGEENGSQSAASGSGTGAGTSLLPASDFFSDRDLEQTADTSSAKEIKLTDGQDVSITEEGVYLISGSAKDVTITVNAPEAKVQLVLDGVTIENSDKPAIYVVDADKVFVTTTDGSSNSFSVTSEYTPDGDTNLDAAIFSKSDLTLNGQGTLTINSAYGNGISTKDELTVTGGTYDITCAEDAMEAHDSVAISDGTFTIKSGKDGIHSEDKDDNTVGSVYISGGTHTIKSGDDGIQGTTVTEIAGGSFDITAVEGIEGTYVQINDGTIKISASDDGINAAQKSTARDIVIEFNGGDTTIAMGQGDTDAVDSNGDIYINGGTIDITANSSFDYNGTGAINGGTVTVNGQQITEMPQGMGGGMHGGMGGGRHGGPRGAYGGRGNASENAGNAGNTGNAGNAGNAGGSGNSGNSGNPSGPCPVVSQQKKTSL